MHEANVVLVREPGVFQQFVLEYLGAIEGRCLLHGEGPWRIRQGDILLGFLLWRRVGMRNRRGNRVVAHAFSGYS